MMKTDYCRVMNGINNEASSVSILDTFILVSGRFCQAGEKCASTIPEIKKKKNFAFKLNVFVINELK